MRMKRVACFTVTAVAVIGTALATTVANAAPKTSPAETAIKAAAKQKRYAFVTFYKKNDTASTKMLADARKLQGKYSSRANFISADIGNAVHKELISRYGVDRSPIPLSLMIAPNGAVTAGYPSEIKETDLSDAFVSNGMADVLKVLQNGKLAAVCLQNPKTKHNKESLAAAGGLNKQAQFRNVVEVVKIDPSDRAEAKFIKTCKVDNDLDEAQIVIIAPPGRIVGKFNGTATTDSITSTLMKSLGGGCSGGSCGPGGCQ